MSGILQKQQTTGAALVTVTNTELLLAYSGRVEATFPTIRSIIKGWLQVALSAGTTGIILRLRRGNGIAGTLVAGGNTQTVTASTTVDASIKFSEQLLNVEFADYSLTIQTVAAGANSTINLASIEVETING
jgi:hypothetical protein